MQIGLNLTGNKLHRYCTGCGIDDVVTARNSGHRLCQFCWDCLQHELKLRVGCVEVGGPHQSGSGPRYLASFYNGKYTYGVGLYLAHTPAEAMAEAWRSANQNNWRLLRVDIQSSLTDIYRAHDFHCYFPGSTKLTDVPYDAERYGPLPQLWREARNEPSQS